jgi:crotonobetainyl-CoA:carnitine CoA-transferase CaiB-like acyl-CoA transferase
MAGPFDGIRILDFTAVLSGPMATAMFADQGAEVIKVETPEGDTTRLIGPTKGNMSAMYIAANRGKRSIAVDLKAPAGRDVIGSLVRRSDVVIENFRPGAMARLGLGYEALAALNPRLVYVSISGFGQTGPDVGGRVYDAVVQAVGGVAAAHRDPRTKEPALLATAICDKLTALTAAQALAAALFARERDGKGRRIELSMLDATLAFQWPDAMYNHVFMDDPPPPYAELDRPDIAADPRFASLAMRSRHAAELRALLEPLVAARTTADALAALKATGTPVGQVNERADVLTDPQIAHNEAVVEIDNGAVGRVRVARAAARFSDYAPPPPRPAPALGGDGAAILRECGYGESDIEALIAQRAIRVPA